MCDRYGVRRGFPLPRYPISARPPASPSPAPLGTLTYFKTLAVANAPHDFTIWIRWEHSAWHHIAMFGAKSLYFRHLEKKIAQGILQERIYNFK